MSEYQVIARKWRPQRFSDVVGQEHILRTLTNAIRNNRTGHAYLFVGPRGVGKTTTARIFAKALNCASPREGEPCCECHSCVAVAADNSLDVIEIDAASHSSVDHMRNLTEELQHLPVSGRYKIYIIDEVHMLSKQAWNALLKSVEEPPPHVKFLFATTEAQQVLPTIMSRCQRFDLQAIPGKLIFDRLNEIAAAENVKVSRGALDAIARAAAGGMRDAQSLLDQMIAFFADGAGGAIDEDAVLELFGLTSSAELESLMLALFANSPGEVVSAVHALAQRGRNLETLFADVQIMLRGIELTMLVPRPADILDVDAETLARYRALAERTRPTVVRALLEALTPVGRTLRDAINKQVFLESMLLKAMRDAHAVTLNDVLARLNQLRTADELTFLDQLPATPPVPSAPPPPIQMEEAPPPPIVEEAPAPIVEAAPPPVAEPPAPYQPKALDGSMLWAKIVEGASGDLPDESWRERLTSAAVLSYADATLTVELAVNPSERILPEELAAIEAQLLAVMQNLTGNWASLLCLEYPEPPPCAPEEYLIEPEPEAVMPGEYDLAQAEPLAVAESASTDDEEEVFEDTAEATYEDKEDTAPPISTLLDNTEELRRARGEAAVMQIEDLFGGDIIEIHTR